MAVKPPQSDNRPLTDEWLKTQKAVRPQQEEWAYAHKMKLEDQRVFTITEVVSEWHNHIRVVDDLGVTWMVKVTKVLLYDIQRAMVHRKADTPVGLRIRAEQASNHRFLTWRLVPEAAQELVDRVEKEEGRSADG